MSSQVLPAQTSAKKTMKRKAFRLSYAQHRLWFLDQLESSGNNFYNIPVVARLIGPLDLSALTQAFDEIVKRHEVLRTTFGVRKSQPAQFIHEPSPLGISVLDLCETPEELREAEALRMVEEETSKPFDLTRGPLLRISLFKLNSLNHVLVLTMHHIISDGWSMDVLVRELSELYVSLSQGEQPSLVELPIQYVDYAAWQREWLQGEVLEKELAYWRQQLEGATGLLELPTKQGRPAVQSYRGAVQRFELSPALSAALKQLSQGEQVTLFMLLLAAFQILLHRHSGQVDISVGTPIAGRTRRELEGLIGFFVNTLVLRLELKGDERFRELLKRVREVCLGAYAHQEIPFEKLVEELQPERSLSHTPLFQVMFLLQHETERNLRLGDLQLTPLMAATETAKFDLTLTMVDGNETISGLLEYCTDLFEPEVIDRMIAHYQTILEGVVSDPGKRLSEIEMLSMAERQQLLNVWSKHLAAPSPSNCIQELFEAQVEKSPDALALVFGDEQLTYRELNCRANQLAHHLRMLGVKEGRLVGIYLESSLQTMIAILGVLKAGAAYLPLDSAQPHERLLFMIENARVTLVLSGQELGDWLIDTGLQVICLDQDWETIASASAENPTRNSDPENLAYVIYTSGSTGKPKGVMVTHANVTRLFTATERSFRFSAQDVWTMFHTYAFDFSVWEMWGALLYGGRLVMVPYWLSRAPDEFYDLLRRERVTVLNQTPSAFRLLMQAEARAQKTDDLGLRTVIFGGEALELESLRPWYARHGGKPALVNGYGITETTVFVTFRRLCRQDVDQLTGSMIGWGIPDLEVYLLDERMQPVPVGVAGEIFVGGAGLTRGYLNRADLTAERFIPHPYSEAGGARLYRTGDRARFNSDGDIEYLGRLDHQVKIRGFRIETSEIELVLCGHEAVKEALVVVREDVPGEKRLVAYVVTELTTDELRAYTRERLPEYMIPSFFVQLESLPLSVNGKVDRCALPAPQYDSAEVSESFVAPRTPAEKALTEIWTTVLGVPQIGVTDNFFVLGGDSIRSMQVVALAKEQGLNITLRQLFKHQTIAELSEHLTAGEAAGAKVHTEPFSLISNEDRQRLSSDIEDAYPLTMLQAGMLFHSDLERESTLYQNYSSLHVRAPFDARALELAIAHVFDRHPVLRTSFDLTRYSVPLQLIHQSVELPLQVDDLWGLSDAEQDEVILGWQTKQKESYLDFKTAPLLRFHVHHRSAETFQFSFVMHHAIIDGWSLATLLTELFNSYRSLLNKTHLDIQSRPSSTFRDFVALEQSALASSECEAFWRQKLSGANMMILPRWPVSSEAPETIKTHVRKVGVSADISDGLKRLAQVANVPIKSVLLAAHLKVMSLLGGQNDVLTGVVSHGRPEETDAERVLGLYLNTLPFRMKLQGGTWMKLSQEVFAAEQELSPYRHYPMAQIKINEGVQALSEVLFSFTHFHIFDALNRSAEIQVLDEIAVGETDFPLTADFSLNTVDGQVNLTLTGKAEVMCAEQMDAFSGYYSAALQAMASDPRGRYDVESLLSEQKRQQLLVNWNDTDADYQRDLCIHELFEQRVAETPDAVAVCQEDLQLSYADLNHSANQIAHYLRATGVGVEDRVAVYVERSLEMIVAILGVLKAGAAYVPLDPGYPSERLHYILDDSQALTLITRQSLLDALSAEPGPPLKARTVCFDRDSEIIAQQPVSNLRSSITKSNLAYLIYTSGSTGQPKAVMIQHGSIACYTNTATEMYAIKSTDRVLQFSSLSFDASLEEIFPCLTQGGTLVLRTDEMLSSPRQFLADCGRHRVTVLGVSTSFWNVLANEMADGEWEQARDVRLVILGGESFLPDRVRAFMQSQGERIRLINSYGPTETTVVATVGEFDRKRAVEGVGIGKPVANMQVYILNEGLQPVPVGVAGELYIGGEGVARGYFDRPDLTADRFVPNPFGGRWGGRLYRTGDRVRYLVDGNIEYLGRMDHQVKIRGYRVELGEIEAALATHELVKEVVVVVREDAPGDKRLVAYVAADANVSLDELRSYLRDRLPEYMVPSFFVLLDKLPLSTNGKIDRQALPAPDREQKSGEAFVGPRTATEQIVAGIWAQVLGLKHVDVDARFFELGGHSLLATQIVSRIRESFGIELPLRALFEAPTVATLSERVDAEQRGADRVVAPPLKRADDDRNLRLSFAQQRLWILHQLDPKNPSYNIALASRITGNLDVATLEQAINEISKRHDALRTVIVEVDGQPVQVIQSAKAVSLPAIDLSELAEAEREARVEQLASAEANRPFDLATGPLYRAQVLRLSDREHVILLTMHHIISDGWSMDVLVRELSELYVSLSQGEQPSLAGLPIQYVDYAAWQREWLQGEVLEKELAYWRQQLEGATGLLELPTKQGRPAVQSYRGAVQRFELSAALSAALKQLSQGEQVTLFMLLLAAFQILLHRHSGQADISVGTPIAGRTRRELEGLIGFFVNTLVLRLELKGDERFRELLKRVREVCLGAYTHQEIPFEKLVEELQPERSLSHTPLFQVMFLLQHETGQNLRLGDLQLTPLDGASSAAKFDLTMGVIEGAEKLECIVEYNRDLFDDQQIRRMLDHYERLLEGIAADPQQRIWELPLMTAGEQQQMLEQGRGNEVRIDAGCVHELFEAQVELTPDAVSVSYEDEQLSYRELNNRANQLAHELRRLGVGPESVVGICVERSPQLMVGLLAVLKAGGAYLPLDPSYPAERLAFMLDDANAPVLLSQQHLLNRLSHRDRHTICLDAEWELISQHSTNNLENKTVPGNLAYVIYTSGSTGRPKGVMIPHEGLINYLRWAIKNYRVSTGAGAPVHSPISFDLTVTSLFCPLLSGKTVHLLAQELGVEALSEALKNEPGYSLVKLTPAHVQLLTHTLPAERVSKAAQVLVIGGEALPGESLRFWQQHAPETRLINEYGPTETVVGCSIYEVQTSDSRASSVPIGRAISNAELFILDKQQQLVPAGVTGELYIGGAGVARGYLQRPEQTAEMFIPHPFSSEPGKRLYKSGDLARYNSEGQIVYLGRGDHQVKLRGHRIELGEVETVLSEHEAVSECFVALREFKSGEKRLVGYVVGVAAHEVSPRELRTFMKRRLPEYMVPGDFVVLDEMPLTPGGKIDRRALIEIQKSFETEREFVAPRTPTEEALAEIWSELLDIERPSIHDNFFDLGGHSLLLTMLASRIRTTMDVDLPLRVLFEQPTIDAISVAILDYQMQHGDSSEIAQMLEEVKQLSPEDVSFHLAAISNELRPSIN